MNEAIPDKPIGDSKKWYFFRRVWDFVFGGHFPIKGVKGVTVEFKDGAYEISAGGNRRSPAGDAAGQTWFLGTWTSDATYSAQQAVEYTPTGGQAGIYIALTDVPTGTAPDTGAPYWYAWPNPLTTRWSF